MLLYIDPGTGSMLFTILIGVLSAGFYFLRDVFVKLKFRMSGGKVSADENAQKLPVVIFSDHKRYWNIFEPILDELERRGVKAVYMTESEDDPGLSKTYENVEGRFIGTGNKAYAMLNMLKASIVLSTTPSLDVFQWKRSPDVDYYIHIAHMPNDITTYRMFGLDFYDAILLSGNYQGEQIRMLEKLRGIPEKEIEYVGLPYMDVMRERVLREKRPENKVRTVLLAPSWGESGLLKKYGEKLIDALVDTGYKLIIRPHPQSFTSEAEMIEALRKKYPDSDMLSWNRDTDNFNVLNESDILLSDFSGVVFEYALIFDKPVICTTAEFDSAPYDCAWIKEDLWTFRILPKLGRELKPENITSVKELIDECIESSEFAKGREEARNETWLYQGEGAKRTADYLMRTLQRVSKEAEKQTEDMDLTVQPA